MDERVDTSKDKCMCECLDRWMERWLYRLHKHPIEKLPETQ